MEVISTEENEHILVEEDSFVFINNYDDIIVLEKEETKYIIVEISDDKSELVTISFSENLVVA